MSEIFREVDEALTYDRLRALWQRHRLKIVATLLLALVSLAAWQAWQYRERQKHLRSAETFFEIARKNETQQTAQNSSQDSSQNSPQDSPPASPQELSPQEQQNLQGGYRMLWLFARAKTFIERQEWQQAQQALQAVSDDGSLPPLYRGYAQIWQASLDVEQGRLEAAEKRLAALKITQNTPALQGLALYLQAAILAAQNNKKDALDLLTRARAKENLPPALRLRLQEAERALDTPNTP